MMHNPVDRVGLYCLLLLLTLNPFHFVVSRHFVYYREILSLLFSLLWLFKLITLRSVFPRLVRPEVFFLVLFAALLVPIAVLHPGIDLYPEDLQPSSALDAVSPSLYVLRNALLYIPLVLYFALRGLTAAELRRIALVSVFVAPFSVLQYLLSSELAAEPTLSGIVQLSGVGLSYITYVPYLTFPALSALYLIMGESGRLCKLFSLGVLCALGLYIAISTSRQAAVFVVFCASLFFLLAKRITTPAKILIGVVALAAAVMATAWFVARFEIPKRTLDRFTSLSGFTSGGRLEIASRGLALLEPYEHVVGAGLASVVGAGPHNEYVRWWQRVGVFGMALGFMPFLIAARKAYTRMCRSKYDASALFVFLAALFTLYYACFGAPREDAYQAPYCFLGLALALATEPIKRSRLAPVAVELQIA